MVRVVSVAQKRSTLEERCRDQGCLFRWGEFCDGPVIEVSVGWTYHFERVDKKCIQNFGW
jgi:hypothetical protein